MDEFSDHQLAFDQTLDEAIEVGDNYLTRSEMIAVLEAKLATLKAERLDG
ncbi:MAG: hypothetical protein ACRDBL_09140 [Rhabdaerophilum sp.]